MIVTLDFITNSSSTVEIIFLPRYFTIELEKLTDFFMDEEKESPTQEDVDRLNTMLNDYRRNGGEMYVGNGGDERILTYYIRNYLPRGYTLGSCETSSDGNDAVFVIPREKIKEILERDCQWVPSEPGS